MLPTALALARGAPLPAELLTLTLTLTLALALALISGAPLAEAWPLSPIALFMWSGEQARARALG